MRAALSLFLVFAMCTVASALWTDVAVTIWDDTLEYIDDEDYTLAKFSLELQAGSGFVLQVASEQGWTSAETGDYVACIDEVCDAVEAANNGLGSWRTAYVKARECFGMIDPSVCP